MKEINNKKRKCTGIIAMNVNGFPSNKANRHKLLELNKLIEDNDIMMILETGINKNNKIKLISD